MIIELETDDVERIVAGIVEALRPLVTTRQAGPEQDDAILDVAGLCAYLKVSPKWVYEQSHLGAIPCIKLGNKTLRFSRVAIDRWLDSLKRPAACDPTGKMRLLRGR